MLILLMLCSYVILTEPVNTHLQENDQDEPQIKQNVDRSEQDESPRVHVLGRGTLVVSRHRSDAVPCTHRRQHDHRR